MTRPERRERWESSFDPARLAIAGVALSALLLFQPTLAGRVAMLVGAAVAAWSSGRRLSPLTTAIVMASIVGANLLVPIGRVVASVGPFRVTETALTAGLGKAVTFEALMFISKACLGPGLRLPGRFGEFFAEALRGYDRILEHKSSVRISGFIKSIDEILVSVYDGAASAAEIADKDRTVPRSRFRRSDMALIAMIMAAGVPLFFN
ncbi:MAG: hypothetical protein CVV47_12250 [Spirochaetae bacterium HGW-Spirochaetae-3]|jgi:hypothetical protein|nr:MAG: hypothetical protein CVV47_12250 [Spirochaetae bacterium HGW-Spirochaetae-3]